MLAKELGMRLGAWTWRNGRPGEDLSYLTCFFGRSGLWVPRQCLLDLGDRVGQSKEFGRRVLQGCCDALCDPLEMGTGAKGGLPQTCRGAGADTAGLEEQRDR